MTTPPCTHPVEDRPHPDDRGLSQAEEALVLALRARLTDDGRGICFAPEDWYDGMEVASHDGRCLVWADIVADDVIVRSVGAYFDGRSTIVAGLDVQLFTVDRDDRAIPPEVLDGTMEEQAAAAAQWLVRMLDRPIERREWSPTVRQYRFADDPSPLTASGWPDERSGPPRSITLFGPRGSAGDQG